MTRITLKLKQPPVITWCVWRIDSSRVRKAHDNFKSALAEAQRLAVENPGRRFLIMQSVRAVKIRVQS